MVDTAGVHPDWQELQAYGLGLLEPDACTSLEDHLAACTVCCERLEQSPGDRFLLQLRAAGSDTTQGMSGRVAGASAIPAELVDHPRYQILEVLGQGGMGTVYRAEHRRMERTVALKVIRPDLMQHPTAVRRFQQEARAAARLHHPNIVAAFDADQAGELHFLVMEYVEGISLAERVQLGGPLPVAEACAYTRQAALGLQHAHERGMVHRDIKPQNLMLSGGTLKVLDFGLVRLARGGDTVPLGGRSDPNLTCGGSMLGTVDYIAPEQAADSSSADIRSDIYSLGCTLFHLVTGQPPFAGHPAAEKLARHASSPLPDLTALRPDVPAELTAVVARMTAKNPADRYGTPAEVAAALAPLCPADAPARPVRRRRKTLVGLLALGLLGAVGVFAAFGLAPVFRSGDASDAGDDLDSPAEKPPTPLVRPAPPSKKDFSQEQAVQLVQRLGGQIGYNEPVPGRKVAGAVVLSGSKVTDNDLRAVAAFKDLRILNLSRTGVTDTGIEHLAPLTRLSNLSLGNTQAGDEAMKSVGRLGELRALNLEFTPVGDAGMKHLGGLGDLTSLNLRGTRVSDAGMPPLAGLQALTWLSLDDTRIADAGLKSLVGLTRLDTLGLSLNRGVSDAGMKSIARLKKLRSLDLYGTKVTDQGLVELAGMDQLESLALGQLKVTDAGVSALAGLKKLRSLDLSAAEITDEGLKTLVRNHPRLETLNLQSTAQISDTGLKALVGLRSLQHLILARTPISDAALAELAGLPQLQFLALSNTEITDAGLTHLANFPQLKFVSLVEASKVTDAGVVRLRQARPSLRIQR